eukprot:TRINITY_DN24230_c0_g1_i1.p1 TRINITY_DN24230_c0_g1~~TRINITY_DN24230_c0_g1_i1.p1  ORF type:complete len:339 (+),score=44.64 TRINITY_DN24230_c0_g1_i1:149-1165(+)
MGIFTIMSRILANASCPPIRLILLHCLTAPVHPIRSYRSSRGVDILTHLSTQLNSNPGAPLLMLTLHVTWIDGSTLCIDVHDVVDVVPTVAKAKGVAEGSFEIAAEGGLVEGDTVEARVSEKWLAKRELEGLRVRCDGRELVFMVLWSDKVVADDKGKAWVAQLMIDCEEPGVDFALPLLEAAKKGYLTVFTTLSAVCDPHTTVTDSFGDTPLHISAEYNHLHIVNHLLASAAPSPRNRLGQTPTHLAAKNGHTAIIAALLTHGADPSARDASGTTPLHDAAKFGFPETVALLLSHGVPHSVLDGANRSALYYAMRYNHAEVSRLLEGHGLSPTTSMP